VRAAAEAAAERRFNEAMTLKLAELRRGRREARAKLERQAAARAAEAERAAAVVARQRADEADGLAPATIQARAYLSRFKIGLMFRDRLKSKGYEMASPLPGVERSGFW